MAVYSKILIAVDFTNESTQVIDRGIALATAYQAQLGLIHVVEYTGTTYTGEIPLPENLDIDQELGKQAKEKLKQINQERGLQAQIHVETGIPKKEITRNAEEQGVDLIVIGSHGRHGIQLLLGSTANGVLHLAKCDVLAVRIT